MKTLNHIGASSCQRCFLKTTKPKKNKMSKMINDDEEQYRPKKPINTRILSKREIRNELFGILAMCDAFEEDGSMVGGERKQELVKYLPKQIASRLMELQDLIEKCTLRD